MRRTRRALLAGGAATVVAGLAGCVSSENDVEEIITDEQQADGIEQLSVETTNGEIQVRGENRETVSLTGHKQAPNENRLQDMTVETSRTGEKLSIAVSDDGGGILSSLGAIPEVDFELVVPASLVDVDAKTTNGDVTVREMHRAVTTETTNGTVSLTDIRGDVEADTTNGNITIECAEPGNVTAETTNGNVELTVPSTIEAQLSLATTNGSLDVAALDGYSVSSESSVKTTLGSGTHRIECETTNGNVELRGRS